MFRATVLAILIPIMILATGCASNNPPYRSTYSAFLHLPEETRSQLGNISIAVSDQNPEFVAVGGGYGAQGNEVGNGVGNAINDMGSGMGNDPAALLVLPILLPLAMAGGAIDGAIDKARHEQNKKTIDSIADTQTHLLADRFAEKFNEITLRWQGLFNEPAFQSAPNSPADTRLTFTASKLSFKVPYESKNADIRFEFQTSLDSQNGSFDLVRMEGIGFQPAVPLRKIDEEDTESWLAPISPAIDETALYLFNQLFTFTDRQLAIEPAAIESHVKPNLAGVNELDAKNTLFSWYPSDTGATEIPYYLLYPQLPVASYWQKDPIYLPPPDWRDAILVSGTELRVPVGLDCSKGRGLYKWTVQPVFRVNGQLRLGVPMDPVYYKLKC